MRCERCGEAVDQYELGGASAIVCQACGFLDVPVDHEPEPRPNESWQDAFDRFYAKFDSEDTTDGDADERASADDPLTAIDGVGTEVAERLRAAGYDTIDAVAAADSEALETVEGVGPKLAARLLAESEAAIDD